MFSKKLNIDIIEKDPKTYYIVKDPDQPPLAIAFDNIFARTHSLKTLNDLLPELSIGYKEE